MPKSDVLEDILCRAADCLDAVTEILAGTRTRLNARIQRMPEVRIRWEDPIADGGQ